MSRRPLQLILLFLGLLMPLACGGDEHQRLTDHRGLWQDAGIAGYAFTYRETGFMALGQTVRIHVRLGRVVAVEDLGGPTPQPVPEDELVYWPTVEKLFDKLQGEVDQTGCDGIDLSVTYDPRLGVPLSVWAAADQEGSGFEVSDFVAEEGT